MLDCPVQRLQVQKMQDEETEKVTLLTWEILLVTSLALGSLMVIGIGYIIGRVEKDDDNRTR